MVFRLFFKDTFSVSKVYNSINLQQSVCLCRNAGILYKPKPYTPYENSLFWEEGCLGAFSSLGLENH